MNASQAASSRIQTVQRIRKAFLFIFLVCALAFLVFGDSRWPSGSFLHEGIELIGLFLIVFCICGRMLCTLYIGGKKKGGELITSGPYSVCRNPLYFFSIVGSVGVGAQLGSIVLAVVTGAVVYAVFAIVILKEEEFLTGLYGEAYAEYLERVPRLFPKLSLWQDVGEVTVNPRLVRMTALDASLFLLSIPVAELFEHLHDLGMLPVLLLVP